MKVKRGNVEAKMTGGERKVSTARVSFFFVKTGFGWLFENERLKWGIWVLSFDHSLQLVLLILEGGEVEERLAC